MAGFAADDFFQATEDQVFWVEATELLANDTDSWGAGLEIVELGGAENGTAYLGFGGVILFSPDPNYAGPASFSYTAIDGEGNAAMAVVTLDVMQVPDFPSALPDFLLGTEDTPLVIGVSELTGNDFSEDFLSVIGVSSGPGGTAVLSEDGQTVLFTPDADFVGQASFVYAVAGGAGSVSATAYIDVAPANAGPVANPDVLECDRNGTATFEVQALLANDYDNEGDAFTLVEVGDATSGSVALSEDGSTITFTPATGFQGFATFSYTLADSRGATSVGQAAVNVAGPPAVADDAFLVREDQKFFLDSAQLLLNDSDPEGQALQVVSVGDATHGTVYLGWGGMISFDPDPDYNGPASFTYTAADASGRTAEATVTLEVQSVDDSPRAAADFFTGVEDTPLFIRVADLLANDWNDDSLTRIVAVEFAQGGTAVLSGDRETILFTPDADFTGQANFQYLVGDGAGFMGTTAYVEVAARNDAPYTEPDALWTSEGVPITYDVQTLLGNDWDRDGDPFELVAVAAGAGGNVVLNQDGTFTFTPTAGFFGDAAFSYVVRDSQGAAAAGQVSVHVGAVNDAPTAVDDFFQASEDTPLQIEIAQLLGNDTDPEGDLLTLDGVGEASNGWAGFDGNTVTFVPDPDYSGPATFSYYGRDAGGIAFSGTVMLDIGARDDAPRSRPDEVEAVEDTPLVIDVADLLGNDWNDDSWASISNVRGAANGTVALSADGSTILFTPDADFIGDAYFEYDVRDATNPSGMGSYVMVHVAGRNDAPIARPDLLTVHEDQPAVFDASDLLANDSDVDGDEVTLVGLATGTGGTVELNEDGTFTFSPAAGFSGEASFSYTLRDSGGATSTGQAIVQVQPVDDGPTAVDDAYFVYEDAPFWVDATELVANDTDPENDVLTVFAAENASHGWVHFDGVGVTFMPDLDYSGPATFTYWARDASGNTTSATVSLDVSPQDDVPRPEFDEVEAVEDTPLVIDVAQLLANDWDDDDLTSITEVGSGYGGTATLSMDRTTILFTPDADFTGQASFIYELNGGEDHGGASSYVNVHVAARNDAPVAVADTLVAYEDQAMVFGTHALLDNDSDVDGGGLELVSVTTGTGGTVELADDGSFAFTFTPPAEFSGQATFSYIVRDSDGLTATGQATVEVVPVNDVPTAPHVTLLPVAEDTQVVLTQAQLLAGASDVDGDALTAWYLRADSGSLWDNLDGTWTYQPGADDDGTVTFEYLVDDGYGSVMATASLDLTPVNDAPRIEQTVLPDATEDTSLVIDAAQLLAGATDVDSTELTVSGLAASSGTVVAIGDGSWRFTPGTDDDAGVVFTFLVGDGEHAVEASAMLDLLPVNDAPVAVADAIEMREDEAQYVWFETLLANDSDVDHDGMEVILVEDASHGSLSFEGGGVVFTPDADYHGIAGFTYTMRDASGLTSTASVAIDILAVNDDPVLAPDLVTGREDTQTVILAGELLANDTDRDSGELSIVDVYGDGNAIVELSEDGSSITFTPAAGYSGPASFYYQVSDGQSATWLGGEVVVNVAPVNDAPVTEADWLEAVEDTPVVFTATALLANDTDPEGSDLRLMGVTSVSGGSVQLTANGAVAFRPDADFAGTASFTYTVADAQGLHANGEATVDVRPVNDAPQVATVQLPALAEDGSRTLTRAQLLAGATDVEGDTLQVSGLVASTGTLVAQGVGVWLFRPRADDDSAVRFDYQVSDGQVAVAGAATLDLTSMPDAPVARDDAIVIQEDARPILLPSTLLANDTDADGDALTVVSVTNPSGSNVRATLNANGTITLVPRADFNGSSSFNYTVRDASGSTATATAQVRVQPVNDAPQAGNDAFTMVAGTSINLTSLLLANDVDPDGDVLRLFSASPDAARFSLQWVGQDLMLTALSTTSGVSTFSYQVRDPSQQGGQGTVSVTVVPGLTQNGTSKDDSLTGGIGHDTLNGALGRDVLKGLAGNDSLDGGEGDDTLVGSLGDDVYGVDSTGDVVTELAGEGHDLVRSSITYTLGAHLENLVLTGTKVISGYGNGGANHLTGNAAGNYLDGALGADTMAGGAGADFYYVDNTGDRVVEAADEGWDTVRSSVNHTLAANVEDLALWGAGLQGKGNALDNILIATFADCVLAGLAGNDLYHVYGPTTVNEGKGEGTDTVVAHVDWTLHENLEHLTLADGSASRVATGNGLANRLVGNNNRNTLDGKGGADTLEGGGGDDSYVVGVGDVVVEASNKGNDTVRAAINYSLGANVENLVLTGTTALSGVGNALNNVIEGNDAANILNGMGGADLLEGGLGNDSYHVDHAGDDIAGEVSGASGGFDQVLASITWSLAGDEVESLVLTGKRDLDGTGNARDNSLMGNGGDNVLDGGKGKDALAGLAGNDTYMIDNAGDTVTESAGGGTDTVLSGVNRTLGDHQENLRLEGSAGLRGTGNTLANVVTGNSGNNLLEGAEGNDTLKGGTGDDSLVGGSGADVLTGGAGKDVITGGTGNDRIVLLAASDSKNTSFDVISDFKRGADRIDLSAIDADTSQTGHQDLVFIGSKAFGADATGQVRYALVSNRIMLYGSTDADATAEFAVQVVGATALTAADLML